MAHMRSLRIFGGAMVSLVMYVVCVLCLGGDEASGGSEGEVLPIVDDVPDFQRVMGS